MIMRRLLLFYKERITHQGLKKFLLILLLCVRATVVTKHRIISTMRFMLIMFSIHQH